MQGKIKSFLIVFLTSLIIALVLTGCTNTGKAPNEQASGKENPLVEKKEVMVSAAASLKKAMTEIAQLYEEKQSDVKLTFNYGSSGSLQKQIEQGAPADVFLSAGKSQMDGLEEKDLIVPDTRVNFVANEVVLIVGEKNNTISNFQDLLKADKISIGTPESVPAGKYAKEVLTNLKLWDTLDSEAKFVLAKDVTQVLTYVESENVEAGIVYGSDAQDSSKAKVVAKAPQDSHSPIIYPGAVVASTQNLAESKGFMAFLMSKEAQNILVKYGFKAM